MTSAVEVLHTKAAQHGLACEGEPAFGWHDKSIGSKARTSDNRLVWVKLISAPMGKDTGREWDGEKSAGDIQLADKPTLIQVHDSSDGVTAFRVIVLELAQDPTVGPSPWKLERPDEIDTAYLVRLRSALRELRTIPTERVNTRFDLVRRRVQERWDVQVSESHCMWETIHGDLHWANLTSPALAILDWEGWGRGLAGQDTALLLAFSGLYPEVVSRIRQAFDQELQHPQTPLALMFVTAELLRMSEMYGDHPELVESLNHLGADAHRAWCHTV